MDINVPTVYTVGDYYVAQLKGVLRRLSDSVDIIDISHSIQSFNSMQAGYVLRNVYSFFPEGTIHLIGVNSEPSAKNRFVIVWHNGHYFVGANNGVFSMIFDEVPKEVYELEPEKNLSGFAALTLFAAAVENIMEKRELSTFANKTEIRRKAPPAATFDNNCINGRVVFIDNFGNLFTNVSHDIFTKIAKGRNFQISVRDITITCLSQYYDDVEKNKYLAMFNSADILEIAMRESNLAQKKGIPVNENIKIEFGNLFY
jgi:S-adenosylmethionine hydrolase